jgi:hypothetical protein
MMSVSRDDEIEVRARHNASDFWEHGPRLSADRRTWIVARGDGMVLRGGLGGFGIGRMWCRERVDEFIHPNGSRTAPDSEDPTYADAPYDPDRPDDFGRRGAAPEASS